ARPPGRNATLRQRRERSGGVAAPLQNDISRRIIDVCVSNRHTMLSRDTLGTMRPQGSPKELERRRRRGIELLKAGASVTEVARRLGCSHSSVILWREVVRRRGLKALT